MKTGSWLVGLLLVAIAAGAGFWAGRIGPAVSAPDKHAAHNEHAGHDHGAGADTQQITLSEQAWKNLGLRTGDVTLKEFWRTISIPAIVGERPGHSEHRVGTTVHGVVTKIHVVPGQTVRPGDALFDVQTTGELIAGVQSNLLKTLQDLDLATTELKRLEPLIERGDIPGVRGIEKKYELQRLESQRLIHMQELLVRGLTVEQVAQIVETRKLVRQFTIRVPGAAIPQSNDATLDRKLTVIPVALTRLVADHQPAVNPNLSYSIEKIDVFPGKMIQPGDELCDLALHDELALMGLGFQRDSELISQVLEHQWSITAVFETGEAESLIREGLKIQYADNVVDAVTRLFKFYIPLDNEVVRDMPGPKDITYRSWRFKPGQRAQLLVPVEHWTNKIVLPTDAVVKEGLDAYVFRQNGKLFERVAVVIVYEDGRHSVLENASGLFPGDVVALNEAYQLNLAMKKAQGGAVADLHAGHSH